MNFHGYGRRKDPNGDVIKKTTPQQAEAKLAALREKIVSGQADFATLARTESDCGSAKEGGDLGYFGPNQMQKPFEEAAFALEIGGLSGIVQSDSGAHIILRTG
eukprot:jgi/Mesvir1/23713/Mv18660-RA.1